MEPLPDHTLLAIGDWLSPTIAVMVGAIFTGGLTVGTRAMLTRRAHNKADDAHDDEIEELVRDMHRALVTPAPTDLLPNPPIGLLDTVTDMQKRQRCIDTELRAVKEQVAEVTKQLTQNGGRDNTILDRVSRIEERLSK